MYVFKGDNSSNLGFPDKLGKIDDDEYGTIVNGLVADAIHYRDEFLQADRNKATAYYRGDALGTEEFGRSQIVMSVVRDVILSMLPSLMRTFDGGQTVVEFMPTSAEDIELCKEQTDAVNYLFRTKNEGFRILFEAIKDALIRKSGILTWEYEEKPSKRSYIKRGMSEALIKSFLKSNKDCKLVSKTLEDDDDTATHSQAEPNNPDLDPAMLKAYGMELPGKEFETYTLRYERLVKVPKVKVTAVPPEEFLISRNARNENEAILIGRTREITIGQLCQMGYDFAEIVDNCGAVSGQSGLNYEAQVRNPAIMAGSQGESGDSSLRLVTYTEVFVRLDRDGDGLPELRRVCTLGDANYILHDEVFEDDEPPFALLCPDPEPHCAIGSSVASQVTDLQEIMSNIVRNTLDSLANSIHPRTAIVENQVNIDDVMNTEVGAIIRMTTPGAVQELNKGFIGQDALSVLSYFDQIRAQRTGITQGSQGLNGDELQSTTAIGISAQLSAAQERLELISRIFAETGLKRLYRGILRTAIRYWPGELPIKRRDGSLQNVDPSIWDPDADVEANVGLGKGSQQTKLTGYQQVLQFQQTVIGQFGLNQPLVGVTEVRNTLEDMLQCAGIYDIPRYFKQVAPNWQPPQTDQQQTDPNTILAQAQMAKAQGDAASAQAKNQLDRDRLRMDDQRAWAQMAQDRDLKVAEINAKYGAQLNGQQVSADVEQTRMAHDSWSNQLQQQNDLQHASEQASQDRQHAAQMAQQAAAQQAAQSAMNPKTSGPLSTPAPQGAPTAPPKGPGL